MENYNLKSMRSLANHLFSYAYYEDDDFDTIGETNDNEAIGEPED
jgi:hypothetical protein